MKVHRLFLDVNVVLDFVLQRNPHFEDAQELFRLATEGMVTLAMSAGSIPFLFFHTRKDSDSATWQSDGYLN